MVQIKDKSIRLIEHYQKELSPRKPSYCKCKYSPSCSEYAMQAIVKYGPYKGWVLAIWRLLRCNPLSKGGHDPVK
jgi:putative membrane protein insertion efficiency factor